MAHKNKVIKSVNHRELPLCVDVFQRPDASFGFDEFRRDPEDPRGWYRIGGHKPHAFKSAEQAWAAAVKSVSWLAEGT